MISPLFDLESGRKMASSSPSGSDSASDLPWVEKHRPIYLKDIVGNEAAVSRLKDIARDGNMPNLILSGPSGVGKTTSILALAHELLGPNYKEAVLELDASDARGIDAVINEITMFAQKEVVLSPGISKIIVLDKVDSVANEAQEALSQTMKVYSTCARFAFTCSVSTDIIEPIWRKCTRVFFSRLSEGEIWNGLWEVYVKEKVLLDKKLEGSMAITMIAGGEMRRALDILQATVRGYGAFNKKNVIKAYKQFSSQDVMKSTTYDETKEENNDFIKELQEEMDFSFQELLVNLTHLRCDVARLIKERDGENERATKLAVENEEHIRNEQSMTRRWKDRFLNKQNMTRKLKVRLLSETRKWKVRFLNEQKMTRRWKVRFADVKVERRKKAKNAKKQLQLLEKEKAELQQKVFELGMVQAAKEKAELQRKVAELEMVQVAKENAELQQKMTELEMVQEAKEKLELQLKVAELEKAQAVIENAKLQQKVAELESVHSAAEQLLTLMPPPLQ